MRRTFVGAWNSCSLSAWTTLPRAASFSRGATESSRSKKTSSAGRPAAFERNLGLDPGTDRQDRRALKRGLLLAATNVRKVWVTCGDGANRGIQLGEGLSGVG